MSVDSLIIMKKEQIISDELNTFADIEKPESHSDS